MCVATEVSVLYPGCATLPDPLLQFAHRGGLQSARSSCIAGCPKTSYAIFDNIIAGNPRRTAQASYAPAYQQRRRPSSGGSESGGACMSDLTKSWRMTQSRGQPRLIARGDRSWCAGSVSRQSLPTRSGAADRTSISASIARGARGCDS